MSNFLHSVTKSDQRLEELCNVCRSLVIKRTELTDAGSWMVVADNGLGKVVMKQIALSVYPSYIPIQV
jgi:hypothetical protein